MVDYVVDGTRRSFWVGFDYSSQTCPEVVRDYLVKKCAEGRVVGPLEPGELPMVRVSHFGRTSNIQQGSGG